jgi:Tol biopolymer transport system component
MHLSGCASLAVLVSMTAACAKATPPAAGSPPAGPRCPLDAPTRTDAHRPQVVAPGWQDPQPLGTSVNTSCPEDAIEISRDGQSLFFFFTTRPLADLPPEEYFSLRNGTYRAMRLDGPEDFGEPVRLDLGKGAEGSLDGELSFSPDGQTVYFHSLRAENTGYQQNPPTDDFLDIYVAEWLDGQPGPARNLGQPVNSASPDGEHALHPDGTTLFFTSSRPGGLGGNDIWTSTSEGGVWSEPANLGEPVNSASGELQPAFTQDGVAMYFTSDRDPEVGPAIYRSILGAEGRSSPELVIRGIVGEPSLTADGAILYFVHVLTDANGVFDADVWYTLRSP